jgi:hypothetical protein
MSARQHQETQQSEEVSPLAVVVFNGLSFH